MESLINHQQQSRSIGAPGWHAELKNTICGSVSSLGPSVLVRQRSKVGKEGVAGDGGLGEEGVPGTESLGEEGLVAPGSLGEEGM